MGSGVHESSQLIPVDFESGITITAMQVAITKDPGVWITGGLPL